MELRYTTSSDKYWKDRTYRAESMAEKTEAELLRDMKEVYQKSLKELNREIEAFYGRYAIENGLSLEEVHKRLDPKQLKSAQEEIKRYYDFAKPEKIGRNMSKEYRDELRRLSARAYMSRLEEIKMRLKHIVMELGVKEKQAYDKAMRQVYADAHAQTAYTIDKGLGFSEGYSAPNADALTKAVNEKWLGENYSDRVWKNKSVLLTAIEQELLSGIAQGHNPRKIAEAMADKYGLSYRNCERLARTETIHMLNSAAYDSYKEHGVEKYQYVCGLDERTCIECGTLDGLVEDLKYAEEGVNYPPKHPNCVLGDNVVLAPDAECLTRSEYSGDIFKIITAKGRNFSVTPNHIMLTSRGWVRAKNLVKGDKVIYYSAWEKLCTTGNPTDNKSIPTIENLFASLTESVPMMRRCMPAAAEDFKGDVIENSKIDIIFIDSLLRGKADISLLKFLSDFSFVKTGILSESVLNADCSMAKLLVCLGLAADCIMKGSSIASIFFGGTLTHHQLVSFRLPSDYNTRLFQSAINTVSGNVKTLGKFVNADTAVIKGDNFINRQDPFSTGVSDSDSVFFKDSYNWLRGAVKNLSEFTDTLTTLIEFDDIIDIQISKSTVHVYDISSKSTLYICNGFVSSNCRCTVTPYFEKDDIDAMFEEAERVAYDEDHKIYEVPASMSYKAWLETVGSERQRTILGDKRYEMYKQGKQLSDFVKDGRKLTLKELKKITDYN